MARKECIAMVLAGGHGKRLSILTKNMAKPAVPFGARYRIIDFTLSNCFHSCIDTVGILTQYEPLILHEHIGAIRVPGIPGQNGGLCILPPFLKEGRVEWYAGTANAVYQNTDYIDRYQPAYVLVLSGDHVYKLDYRQMLRFHKEKEAMVTVASMEVPWHEAGRFGLINIRQDRKIHEFEEKPGIPRSNLASMGIYVFNWPVLKTYLQADGQDHTSSHDFGKDVLPRMLRDGVSTYAYPFKGYWKDVGTVDSLWQANMDLLGERPLFDIYDPRWPIYTVDQLHPPHFFADRAKIRQTLIGEGCLIYGEVYNSVLSAGVHIAPGAVVKNSVILPMAKVGSGAQVDRAIIGNEALIEEQGHVGYARSARIAVVSPGALVSREVCSDYSAGWGEEN